jgi:hypothetical protein
MPQHIADSRHDKEQQQRLLGQKIKNYVHFTPFTALANGSGILRLA